ncbi:MAG: aspartate/glutamate racemase family protein [Tabrizicola sp.]|uniref:aspartate/glutamate racemase family protein n=1 Tax=Tabrizicola sp. TaxID=2005166 RepID=UPI002735AB52|nr:aspartate/glutamate racemase family protein [Tabrizicola sp.]MDP3265047.1 aspartate/glutamate racemase family protein [Tabrizicola sp.]MDP3647410.1 aspartate/glutamate racemase family protein [Paracoccaceae bacterium]MDZ4066400.1 aspartate/glutamate racemase family protein [Tabrizicola sp.]
MTIYIINPNSSRTVTDGIDRAMQPFRGQSPVGITAVQIDEGPKGIETQAHVDGVVTPLLRRAEALEADASAFIVACFSDPGLAALREQSRRPVLGIAESAILTAMTLGQRFGILSILWKSVPRHMRMLGAMGVKDRLAADLPLELGVADLTDRNRTFGRLRAVGTTLRDTHGAEVLILGCAGMTSYRADLSDALGCPVVEPCEAAAAMAIGRVALARAHEGRNI